MKWKFSNRSLKRMEKMHPDLKRVFHTALKYSKYDFGIGEVERSIEQQKINVRNGFSWTMNSKHLVQDDGYVHAGDVVVYKDGVYARNDIGAHRKVAQAFVTAAIEHGVQIELGALWESVFDGPHIELN